MSEVKLNTLQKAILDDFLTKPDTEFVERLTVAFVVGLVGGSATEATLRNYTKRTYTGEEVEPGPTGKAILRVKASQAGGTYYQAGDVKVLLNKIQQGEMPKGGGHVGTPRDGIMRKAVLTQAQVDAFVAWANSQKTLFPEGAPEVIRAFKERKPKTAAVK